LRKEKFMAEDTVVHDDAYYIELGKQAAAQKDAETPLPLTFGPMAPIGPKAPPAPLTDAEKEDALVARILQAVQQAGGGSAPAPSLTQPAKPVSKEDQRVLDEMSRLFPTGRDTAVLSRVELGNNLFLAEITYTPHSGVRYSEKILLLDDGKNPLVVWRAD
jgi:hypothetical protein